MGFTSEQKSLLGGKLDPKNVKKPSGQYGPKGDYIEGWHAIAEANRIFGFDGWSYRIVEMTECHKPYQNEKGNSSVAFLARVEVTAGGVTREDVGYGSGFAKQVGDAYESAVKEAVTDALKRSLKSYGNPFGLALYDKTQANVGVDEAPRSTKAEPKRDGVGDTYVTEGGFERKNGPRLTAADSAALLSALNETVSLTATLDDLRRFFKENGQQASTLVDADYDAFKTTCIEMQEHVSGRAA